MLRPDRVLDKVAIHELAKGLDVFRRHPTDRMEVIVHRTMSCETERHEVIQPCPEKVPLACPNSLFRRRATRWNRRRPNARENDAFG